MAEEKTVTLLDGGMGQELIRRSGCNPTPMWSAQVMLDSPEIVRDLHIDFIRAGASVITLNAYSATPERLKREASIELFPQLQHAAIKAAQAARKQCGEAVRIAGCLPPLHGSYRPEIAPQYDESLALYQQIAQLQAPHVDLFLCETMSSVKEAKASAIAALECDKPVWSALSVDDDGSTNLRSGEPVAEALTMLHELEVDAVLLNCSKPESIDLAWPQLEAYPGITGAYANGFTSVEALAPGGLVSSIETRQDLNPEQYAKFAMNWVNRGATLIGGCCEIGPEHIHFLHHQLVSAGYLPPS